MPRSRFLGACWVACSGLVAVGCYDNASDAGRDDATGNGATVERVPLRRLTNAQYDNVVHDLLGIDGHPGADFTEDELSVGFTSNGLLPVQGLQLDQYDEAAIDLAQQATRSHLSQVVPCAMEAGAECAAQFVQTFGARAFRRPLTQEELTRYGAAFAAAESEHGFSSGVELVLRAMLQSPYFLYRVELGDPKSAPEADGARRLSSYEVASRLSLLLWNSMPDSALFDAAGKDALGTADAVEHEARRMLDDPKAREGLASFHRQWLGIETLPTIYKDGDVFDTFNTGLRNAMATEAIDFIDDVLRHGDGRLETLLTAHTSLISGPLYAHYGLPAPADPSTPARVELPADQRAGILTLPAVLTTHAHENQTSIVHRGMLVRSQLFCQDVSSPPPDVDTSLPQVDPNVSWRTKFEQHRSLPTCNGCHARLDPLGVTFENYDPIGRYRVVDGTQPIDASGELTDTPTTNGLVSNAVDLAHRIAPSDDVRQCVARQWLRYAFGHDPTMANRAATTPEMEAFRRSDFDVVELLVAITRSRNFRYLETRSQ